MVNTTTNKVNNDLLKSVKSEMINSYTPLLLDNLNRYLMNQINEISSIEEVASYMTNLSYIDREIKSMNLLSTDKTSLIDKLKPEEKLYDKMVTQYNGNYQSFSEVFNDFYKQNRKEIGVRSLAIRAKVSTATVTDLLKDNDSKKSNSMRRLNGLEQSRDKILSQFDINPPESLEEIIKLPIFTK